MPKWSIITARAGPHSPTCRFQGAVGELRARARLGIVRREFFRAGGTVQPGQVVDSSLNALLYGKKKNIRHEIIAELKLKSSMSKIRDGCIRTYLKIYVLDLDNFAATCCNCGYLNTLRARAFSRRE